MNDLVAMSAEDAREYSESLAQIGHGWWRQVAWAFRQRIPEALGMSRREWAETYHGYIKMPINERREAVAELAASGMSQREIADALGVDPMTVNRDLKPRVANATDQLVDEPDTGDAECTPVENSTPEQGQPDLRVANATPEPESWPESSMDEPDWAPPVADATPQPEEEPEPEPEPEPVSPQGPQINEGDEWYTPRWLFDALGILFSIDVCAPLDRTFSSVPADRYFTIEDDGLAQPWEGTVWCNPPYSKPEPWARRMIHHGDGLLLTHIPMNAGWCVDMWDACDAIRLFQAMEFVRPDGTSQRPGYWLQLAAFGPVATEALRRLQPLGSAAENKRRVASPMWQRAA